MIVCYLSGPITNGGKASPKEREENCRRSHEAHADLVALGVAVINPVLSYHVDPNCQISHATWLKGDFEIVKRCDCVLRLPGESSGAEAECRLAKEHGIPVFLGLNSVLDFAQNHGKQKPQSALTEAMQVAGKDRSRDYGHPLDNHERIARLWNAYLDNRGKPLATLQPEEVAWMMILLKVAREQQTPKRDNLVDTCGYVRCIELMQEKRAEQG